MDILEVLADDLADGAVIRDEVGKAQAPGTPVATHLTDDELAFRLSFRYCLAYLLEGINCLIIYLFQPLCLFLYKEIKWYGFIFACCSADGLLMFTSFEDTT